jgi:hypothetical protein
MTLCYKRYGDHWVFTLCSRCYGEPLIPCIKLHAEYKFSVIKKTVGSFDSSLLFFFGEIQPFQQNKILPEFLLLLFHSLTKVACPSILPPIIVALSLWRDSATRFFYSRFFHKTTYPVPIDVPESDFELNRIFMELFILERCGVENWTLEKSYFDTFKIILLNSALR